MIFQLLPLLCGLATLCFSSCIKSSRQIPYLLLGFVIGLGIVNWGAANPIFQFMVSPQELAIVAAVSALLLLRHHDWRHFGLVLSGLIAAFWVSTLEAMGAPYELSLLLVCGVTGLNVWAALKRQAFITDSILDEALLIVFVLGLIVGLVPEVINGWRSAGALQALDTANNNQNPEFESLLVALSGIVLGIGWSLLRNQRAGRR